MGELLDQARAFYDAPYPQADAVRNPRPASPRSETVAVTVLSCGRPEYLQRTLSSFLANCLYPHLHIIVLDQGRGMETRWWLRWSLDERHIQELIELNENVGPAEGRNRLLAAVPKGIEYVFHVEDDWEFTVAGDWISRGIEIIEWTRKDPTPVGAVRYRHKGSDDPASARIQIGAAHAGVMYSEPGSGGFTNTPNLARMESYGRCGRFEDPQHEWRYDHQWKTIYRWAQFIRVCHHIGGVSAFTPADVARFDDGKKMCSGGVRDACE